MKKSLLILSFIALASFSFISKKTKKFKTPENFVFVPSGTSMNAEEEKFSCAAFYMLEHEVTNLEYKTFLKKLKADGRIEDYNKSYPDSTKWLKIGGFMEPMAQVYFWHPAYENYPAVNISKEGAKLYCAYLTDFYRKEYGESVNDFRLPTKEEWIYAARGNIETSIYPWEGPTLRNDKGCYLANFKPIGDQNIKKTKDGLKVVTDSSRTFTNGLDGGFFMVDANSYSANNFGLYNMSGNVAELVSNESISMGGHWNSPGYDIRVVSEEEFESANPFVGFRPVLSFMNPTK